MGSAKVQRRFWDPVYDRLSGLYDAVDWLTFNTMHRLRLRALPYLPPENSRLLEIGFGSGRLHRELAGSFYLYGLDLAPGMAQLTKRRLEARNLVPRLCVGDVSALPWPDAHFDAVLSTFVFSAFPEAGPALDEMVRVTRPGGKVLIVDAGEAVDGNRMAHFFAWLWERIGDCMRDEVPLMEARGLLTEREDYGPWGSVHITVGTVPPMRSHSDPL
jgi:ubiquinone/menaquinone biosynthesis C-methylase UbiE